MKQNKMKTKSSFPIAKPKIPPANRTANHLLRLSRSSTKNQHFLPVSRIKITSTFKFIRVKAQIKATKLKEFVC
jgi:hypothetical protein